jgi:hypothetical protein
MTTPAVSALIRDDSRDLAFFMGNVLEVSVSRRASDQSLACTVHGLGDSGLRGLVDRDDLLQPDRDWIVGGCIGEPPAAAKSRRPPLQ